MKGHRHGKTRILAVILALLLCIVSLPTASMNVYASESGNAASTKWTDYAATEFASGSGDGSSAENAAQLALFSKEAATYQGKYVKLTAAIDLTAYEWVPISSFAGEFDGNGYSITGLWIGTTENPADIQNAGLFAGLEAGSVVKNLTLNNVSINTKFTTDTTHAVGAVVAYTNGSIDNCVVNGVINAHGAGATCVGGVAGYIVSKSDILIQNSGNNATVTGISDAGNIRIGGLIGLVNDNSDSYTVSVVNCYNTGNVTEQCPVCTELRVGGMIGDGRDNSSKSGTIQVHNSYNVGTVTVTNTTTGGKRSIGSVIGMVESSWTNNLSLHSNLYSLTDVIVRPSSPTTAKYNYQNETNKTLAEMQSADFVAALNSNVDALVAAGTYTSLKQWVAVDGGTPVITAELGTPAPETASLTINVTGAEYGTVAVAASVSGGDSYVNVGGTSPYSIVKGSSVKVTFTPNDNCESVVAPEGSELQDGSYVYTISSIDENITLAVEFKGNVSTKWTGHAATELAGGTGTEADPYLIETAAQLALLAKDQTTYSVAGLYFKLTENIDLSEYEWVPFEKLRGTFDGNGKKISGLRIGTEATPATDLADKPVGLFGQIVGNGTVKDLTVEADIYVSDASDWEAAGIIVGYLQGKLENCIAQGSINVTRTYAFVGGIAGHLEYGGRIRNCGNEASVYGSGDTANSTRTRVGGIAGSMVIGKSHNKSLLIENCYNVGTITATGGHTPYAGGIAGYVQNSSSDQSTYQVSLYNCYNAGKVEITGHTTTKGKMGNISATTTGAVNTMYLYGVSDTLSTGDHVSAVNMCTDQTDKTLAEMKAADFVESLTLNADILVGNGVCEAGLMSWTEVTDATPVLSGTAVTGTKTTLNVTVKSSRLGSVTVKADETGGENYTLVTKMTLEKGSKVQLSMIPVAGCALKTLTLNGAEQTVSGDTFTFTLTGPTEIEVAFEVVSTVDVDAIYVDPNVTVTGDGTKENPFQTLEQAKQKVQTVLATTPNANITVYLMGGTYLLEETFELGKDDTSLGRITYKNYNDETPVITSGHKITESFTKVDGEEYYSYQLPDSAKVENSWPQFRDLLVNGERATIARTEELTFKHTYPNSVYGSATSATTVVSCDNAIYVSPEAFAGIDNSNFAGVEIVKLVEWKSLIFHIGSVTGNTLDGEIEATIDQDEWDLYYATDHTKKSLVGRGYWLQNHINFLDAPGEFYYDQSTGTIYYYPLIGQDMTSATVEYATLDTLINMENAANITFDGISFTGTTANYINDNGFVAQLGCTLRYYSGDEGHNVPFAAVKGDMVEGIQVQNCSFEELGGPAMVFDFGIKDLQITGNVIKDIAMAGIQVGKNQVWWNEDGILGASEDVTISNNYITNVGTLVSGAPAIKVARSENLKIQYNKIVHVPYSAIMAGYGFNVSPTYEGRNTNLINADISYNYIEDYLYKINDGGAIYTCGPNGFVTDTSYKNEIHHNYVRAGAHNVTYTGIYHDGSASNWYTHDNLIDDLKSKKSPMFFQDDVPTQYTHNILAENNYTTASIIVQNGATDNNGAARNIVLQNNTMFSDRSKLSTEALAIMNGAGLQDAYKHLESPMDAELRIADNSMHYEVNKKQEGNTIMQIELTNNSAEERVFTISVTNAMPDGIDLIINSGNSISVAAGETKIVEAEFVITDADKVVDTEDYVVGFEVKDNAGRAVSYPRTFTIKTLSGNVAGEIPYGTPTVDGILDEAYLEGTRNFFGPVFHPDTYTETDISGGYYLLWDENYLYCYVIVDESTVMSRGTEWIAAQIAAGQQGNLWATDAVETYIKVPSIRSGNSKFAVDAFGITRFGNANISLEHHNYLPYATKFTYNGEIIDKEIPATIAAGQTATEAMGTQVTGYVVEMTLPLTKIESIIYSADGVPSVDDTVEFYIQNNDYRGLKPDGSVYTVANANTMAKYTLKAKEEPTPTPELDKVEILSEGTYKSYTQGSNENASIHCTGKLDELESVAIDGKKVDKSNYTVEEDPTIVSFKAAYLETLSVGDHTVTLNYSGGRSVDTTLTILAKVEVDDDTSEDSSSDTDDYAGSDANEDSSSDANDDADNDDVSNETETENNSNTDTDSASAAAPNTGDNTSVGLWVMLLVLSIGTVASAFVFQLRRKRN